MSDGGERGQLMAAVGEGGQSDIPTAIRDTFGAVDYTVFVMLLAVSLGIGFYYGWFQKKNNNNVENYLLGGRSMGVFPISMSLIASFMSAITLLGTPAEIYQFGTMYLWSSLSFFLVMPAAAYLYMPIFFDLHVISAYQYLEKRFHQSLRIMGAIIFAVQMCIYMAIVVYAPSLALNQVTKINVHLSVFLIFFVCIIYTSVGGIKAVLWTDTLQVFIMYFAMLAIVIKGTVDVGGIGNVWSTSQNLNRIEFDNFNLNPGVRHTFWTLLIGGYFTWVTIYGVNQAQVQRYLCVPTKRQARQALWINSVGLFLLMLMCGYVGLLILTRFAGCDPIRSHLVAKPDQLFPLFVVDVMGNLPGVPGLFVACIFSGTLSTVSSGINSLAAVALQDFINPLLRTSMSYKKETFVSKLLAVAFGIFSFCLVFIVEQLEGVLEAALKFYGMLGGPLLGLFTLGLFIPWANWKGAMVGTLTGLATIFWIGFGTIVAANRGLITHDKLQTHTDKCNFTMPAADVTNLSTTVNSSDDTTQEYITPIYHLSYMYYSTLACCIVCFVGTVVSFCTGVNDPEHMNPQLCVRMGDTLFFYLPTEWREQLNFHTGRKHTKESIPTDKKLELSPTEQTDSPSEQL